MYAHNEFEPGRAAGVSAAPEKLTAAGAISAAVRDTQIDLTQAGDQAFTLADGTEGQEKVILLMTKGGAGNAVVTPANLQDGTTITLNSAGDIVSLKFMGGQWHVMVNKTATVA